MAGTLSLAALSLTALPAATDLAKSAAESGARLGGSFLKLLSNLAPGDDSNSTAEVTESAQIADDDSDGKVKGDTKSWCQRFMQWVSQQRSGVASGDLQLHLSLDELDQPHIDIEGEGAEELEATIANDSTWLQEFRELAFDQAHAAGKSTPMSLKLSMQSGSISNSAGTTTESFEAEWLNR